MILDPDSKYIQAIIAHTRIAGATILEIGCGDGRITRDLAKHAAKIIATDLDSTVLDQAKKNITANNIEFLYTPDGTPDLPAQSIDIVIYTLSLHHVPKNRMADNLRHSGRLLKDYGQIVVVEPGHGGSFAEIKKRFGAGSGDESQEKRDAMTAMENLENWILSPTHLFEVEFQFADEDDFFVNKLPNYKNMSVEEMSELKKLLKQSSTDRGIILTSGRRLNLLTREYPLKNGT